MLSIVAAVGTPVIIPMTIMAFITAVTTEAVVSTTAVTATAATAKRKDLPDLHAPLPLLFLSRNGLFQRRRAHRENGKAIDDTHPATRYPAVIYGKPKRATTEHKTGPTSWLSFEPHRQMVRPEAKILTVLHHENVDLAPTAQPRAPQSSPRDSSPYPTAAGRPTWQRRDHPTAVPMVIASRRDSTKPSPGEADIGGCLVTPDHTMNGALASCCLRGLPGDDPPVESKFPGSGIGAVVIRTRQEFVNQIAASLPITHVSVDEFPADAVVVPTPRGWLLRWCPQGIIDCVKQREDVVEPGHVDRAPHPPRAISHNPR